MTTWQHHNTPLTWHPFQVRWWPLVMTYSVSSTNDWPKLSPLPTHTAVWIVTELMTSCIQKSFLSNKKWVNPFKYNTCCWRFVCKFPNFWIKRIEHGDGRVDIGPNKVVVFRDWVCLLQTNVHCCCGHERRCCWRVEIGDSGYISGMWSVVHRETTWCWCGYCRMVQDGLR